MAVSAGPSVTPGQTRVPYFVRVLDGSGTVVQGQDFTADFKLSSASPRGESREELALTMPFGELKDLTGYRIAVGLKPTSRGAQLQPAGRRAVSAYADRLEALAADAADRCTGCGKCFEVCPTAREIGLDAGEARARVGELSALTRTAARRRTACRSGSTPATAAPAVPMPARRASTSASG